MKLVFDTEVILKFYLGEKNAGVVRDYLVKVSSGEAEGFMNVLNLAEFYYILYRKSAKMADEKLASLKHFGIKQVDIKGDTLWKEAVRIKAGKGISLPDAFAIATAKELKARLLIGDDVEFEGLEIDAVRI